MSFQDLSEFFDASLSLPINGKTYVIQSPSADLGLWCQAVFELVSAQKAGQKLTPEQERKLHLNDDEERDIFEQLLGDTFQEMVDDGVKWEYIKHAGQTTMIWVGSSKGAAEAFWVSPKAPSPKQPQDRKPPSKRTAKASPAGSRSKPKPAKKAASSGATSSSTGA